MNAEVLHIQDSDELSLRDAYRTLPRVAEINLFTHIKDLDSTLRTMESVGFIGMEILYVNPSSGSLSIRAYKGKSGPCYNTGRIAVYHGAAIAALDDDNHLLFVNKSTPVCEKTARIYQLPAYKKLVNCSEANPDLIAKLDSVPEIFNCNSFEADQEKLFQTLKDPQNGNESTYLFYPGPFRLLILKDGRVIKRGNNTLLPKSDVTELIKKDNLFRIENVKPEQPLFFQEIYPLYGARCLLDNNIINEMPEREGGTDFTRLGKVSRELKEHLVKLITQNKKFFVLTGSDAGDKLGCCPSEVVTAANDLVAAGILDSYRQPVPGETCPVTVYAFRNEMKVKDNDLLFNIDNDFREVVHKKLDSKTNNHSFMLIAKWILLAFLVVSLTVAFLKIFDSSSHPGGLSLYEQLVPWTRNQQMILLFHYTERCSQCLNMEKYTNELLNEDFPEMVANKEIQFKLIEMDQPENRNLVDRFGLFTTTIVLVRFENYQEEKINVLKDSWKYSDDEISFKAMLKKELDQY